MRRRAGQLAHLGPNRHQPAVDLDRRVAGGERRSAGAARLEAGEQDHVARVGRERLEMVQHPAAGRHAARGHDHQGPVAQVQGLGVLGRVDVARRRGHRGALLERQAMLAEMAAVDLGHVGRHRTVQEDRDIGDGALRLQARYQPQDRLRAADGERWDDDHAAACRRGVDRIGEFGLRIDGRMTAIPVGGLDHERIGGGGDPRRQHDRIVRAADVAREQDAALRGLETDHRRAQNVAGGGEAAAHLRAEVQIRLEVDGHEGLQGAQRLGHVVQGQRRPVLRVAVAIRQARLLFLEVAAVRQHDPQQIGARVGAVRLAGEPLAHQDGQIAAVIDVRMGEQHRVDRARVDGQRLPIAQPKLLVALEQPAIDQDAAGARFDEVFRARDGPGGSQERDLHRRKLPARSR